MGRFLFYLAILLLTCSSAIETLSIMNKGLKMGTMSPKDIFFTQLKPGTQLTENEVDNTFSREDPLSPLNTWIMFNRNDAIQKKKDKKKKCKKCSKYLPMPKVGPVGPTGKRGPQGPPGIHGGILSLTDIENFMKDYISDLTTKNQTVEISSSHSLRYKVPVVFSAFLPRKEVIPSYTARIVSGLSLKFGVGQVKRGAIIRNGQFTVSKSGIYQINASFLLRNSGKSHYVPLTHDRWQTSIFLCVSSCTRDRRLRWSGTIPSHGITAVLSGVIQLRRGQTMMVLAQNADKRKLEIWTGSTLSVTYIGS